MRLARATIAVATFLLVGSLSETWAAEWNLNNNGEWLVNSNWTNPATAPNAAGAVADFTKVNITANRSITITTGTVRVGSMSVGDTDGTHQYTFQIFTNPSARLSFDDPSGVATVTTTGSSATNFTLPILLPSGTLNTKVTGSGQLNFNGSGTFDLTDRTLLNDGAGSGAFAFGRSSSTGTLALAGTNAKIIQDSATSDFSGISFLGSSSITGDIEVKQGQVRYASFFTNDGFGTMSITLGDTAGGSNDAGFVLQPTQTDYTFANPFVLSPNNTGTLKISIADYVFASRQATLTGGVTGSNSLTVENTGGDESLTFSTALLNFSGTLTHTGLGTGTATISADIGSNVQGVVQNSASSRLILTSNGNAYGGPTSITAGTLQLGVGGASGGLGNTTGVTVSTGATLAVNRADTVTQSVAGSGFNNAGIGGAGNLTQAGSGTTILDAANTYTGTTTVAAGTLQVGNGGASGDLGDTVAVNVAAGATLAVNRSGTFTQSGTGVNASVISGSGNFTQAGPGTTILDAANTYTGTTTVAAGTLQLGNGGTSGDIGGTSAIAVASGATFAVKRSDTVTQSGAGVGLNSRVISGSGGFTQAGTGMTVFDVANTYGGPTQVNAGTLTIAAAGSIANTSAIDVAGGGRFIYSGSTALALAPTLAGAGTGSRAVLGGTGTINAALTLDNVGDVLAPGNSPGIQPYAVGQTWGSFSYDWEVNDWTGSTAGTAFDQITIAGGLALSGTSYGLNLLSLTAGNAAGILPNFSESDRSWTILSASGGITGFDAGQWAIDTTGFTTSPAWQGTFSLATANEGQDLVLSYAINPIPEPSTYAMGICGAGFLGLVQWFRRRRVLVGS